MISKTKYNVDNETIKALFSAAGISDVMDMAPLGAGEFNAVYQARAGDRAYALKIAPPEYAQVMAYEQGMMASEVFWYQQMREHTDIRVPKIIHAGFDKALIPANWFIMDLMPGTQLDKMKLTPEEKTENARQLAKMAAQLHNIKNGKFGYVQNGLYPNWHLALMSMVTQLRDDARKKNKACESGAKLLEILGQRKGILEKVECSMVNFDIWPPNILCERKNGRIEYSWIDPERSFWGDPILDFVCLEFGTPLEKKEATLSAYNKVARKPVAASADERIRYAIAQGFLGLIMEVEKYYRYTPRHFGWWRNVLASKMLFKTAFDVLGELR
jgi:aminoglycoside phosphotransferase (APT) family kinase protein